MAALRDLVPHKNRTLDKDLIPVNNGIFDYKQKNYYHSTPNSFICRNAVFRITHLQQIQLLQILTEPYGMLKHGYMTLQTMTVLLTFYGRLLAQLLDRLYHGINPFGFIHRKVTMVKVHFVCY